MKLPLKLNNNNNTYWSLKKFFSYGNAVNTDIVIGGRGIGKTTTALITAGNMFNSDGSQFVLIRRYKTELKKVIDTKPLDYVFDGIIYKTNKDFYRFNFEKETVGYAIPLSTSIDFKSTNFSKVKLIIYDEATLIRGGSKRYLDNEVQLLLELISTIVRTRTDYKVLILGNNVDLFNPYFSFFSIPTFDTIYIDKKRGLMAEMPKNSPALIELEKKTPLYKLVKGTQYADYHYDNQLLVARKIEVISPPAGLIPFITIVLQNCTVYTYFYTDKVDRNLHMYITHKPKREKGGNKYVLYTEDGILNTFYLDLFKRQCKATLTQLYYNNKCAFESQLAGDMFSSIMEVI